MIPYAYRSGASPLHRCPAGIKLLCLLAVSAGAFSSIPGLAAATALVLIGALIAGIRPGELLRGSKTVLILAALSTLIRTVRFGTPDPNPGCTGFDRINLPVLDAGGFQGGLHQGLCFIVSFAAGALLFSVTTMQELRDSLDRAGNALAEGFQALRRPFSPEKGVPPGRRHFSGFSLGLSLMLGFLPRFFERWEAVNLAFDARAGKRGLRRLIVLIPLVIERMMEMAGETAEALDSRGLLMMR
jgi:biotin transport system permease protein